MPGRWTTMAQRSRPVLTRPPHVTRPMVGETSPVARRSREDFPDPLGPISTVGAPGASTRDTDSRMVTLPLRRETSSIVIGSSLRGARMISSGMEFAKPLCGARSGIDRDDQGNQHDAEAYGERQVTLGRLQGDCGRHRAREAIDIAAHDHDSADLAPGAPEAAT